MTLWQTLAVGFGIMLILEGMLPLLSPLAYKKYLLQVGLLPTRTIRVIGLFCLLAGAAVFHLAK